MQWLKRRLELSAQMFVVLWISNEHSLDSEVRISENGHSRRITGGPIDRLPGAMVARGGLTYSSEPEHSSKDRWPAPFKAASESACVTFRRP
jgi:hypothetical protein